MDAQERARLRLLPGTLLLLFFLSLPLRSLCTYSGSIDVGFTGSPMGFVDTDGDFLYSPGSVFSLSFYSPGTEDASYLCIMHMPSKYVVWTANRDAPLSHSDQLRFSMDGNAVLAGANGSTTLWTSNTTGLGAKRMLMLDSGNLVIADEANSSLWQSFDHPTDTLLTGQALRTGMTVTSNAIGSNLSAGLFSLTLADGDLSLLYRINSAESQTYWSTAEDVRVVPYGEGTPSYAFLNSTGLNLISDGGDVVSSISWSSNAALSKASVQSDGNMVISVFSSNVWATQFTALQSVCSLPLSCGAFGVCRSGQCSCPAPLQPLNANNIAQGCHSLAISSCKNVASQNIRLEKVGDGLDYFANSHRLPASTSELDGCKKLCLQNCSCGYFFFHNETGSCFLYPQLGTIQSAQLGHMLFVKTSKDLVASNATDAVGVPPSSQGLPPFLVPLVVGLSSLIVLGMACAFLCWFLKMHKAFFFAGDDHSEGDDIYLDNMSSLPTRFSFKELRIATKNFSTKLGEGGFGSVYEGILPNKTRVAVKRLEGAGAGQGKKEFRAEVAIIGKIHHVHLVQLYGFCAEGSHRLLVYEFLANGSLDKCLFVEGKHVLDWAVRYQIALGTARGLAYLHDDCREKIIHCDIKPENILLDESYNAKVSDFGLAKFLSKEQSHVFTTMRGTRGYLAPEWLMNLAISEKSDVYSFGMVLLEIISGRKNLEAGQISEKRYFPSYAFQQVEKDMFVDLADGRIKADTIRKDELARAVKVALSCIQEEVSLRPSMAKVVQMLEGNLKIPDPPHSSFVLNFHSNAKDLTESSETSSTMSYVSKGKSTQSAVRLSEAR